MNLATIAGNVRKASRSGALRALLVSAGVAAGIVQLQTLAAEANDTMEAAKADQERHTDHIALLQAQISDLEATALESVRAAIRSGVYDDAAQDRVMVLQAAAATLAREHNEQHQNTPYPGCPRCDPDPRLDDCGMPFPCAHRAHDANENHPVVAAN